MIRQRVILQISSSVSCSCTNIEDKTIIDDATSDSPSISVFKSGTIHIHNFPDFQRYLNDKSTRQHSDDCSTGLKFLSNRDHYNVNSTYTNGFIIPSILRLVTESPSETFNTIGKNRTTMRVGCEESFQDVSISRFIAMAMYSLVNDVMNQYSCAHTNCNKSKTSYNDDDIDPFILDLVVPTALSFSSRHLMVDSIMQFYPHVRIANVYSSAVSLISSFILSNEAYELLLRKNGILQVCLFEIGEEYINACLCSVELSGESFYNEDYSLSTEENSVDHIHRRDKSLSKKVLKSKGKLPPIVVRMQSSSGLFDYGLKDVDTLVIQEWLTELFKAYHVRNKHSACAYNTSASSSAAVWAKVYQINKNSCLWAFYQYRLMYSYDATINSESIHSLFDRLLQCLYADVNFIMAAVSLEEAEALLYKTLSSYGLHSTSEFKCLYDTLHDIVQSSLKVPLLAASTNSNGVDDDGNVLSKTCIDAILLWHECCSSPPTAADSTSYYKKQYIESNIIKRVIDSELKQFLCSPANTGTNAAASTGSSSSSGSSSSGSSSSSSSSSTSTITIHNDSAVTTDSDSVWKIINPSGNIMVDKFYGCEREDMVVSDARLTEAPLYRLNSDVILDGLLSLNRKSVYCLIHPLIAYTPYIRIYEETARMIGITIQYNNRSSIAIDDVVWLDRSFSTKEYILKPRRVGDLLEVQVMSTLGKQSKQPPIGIGKLSISDHSNCDTSSDDEYFYVTCVQHRCLNYNQERGIDDATNRSHVDVICTTSANMYPDRECVVSISVQGGMLSVSVDKFAHEEEAILPAHAYIDELKLPMVVATTSIVIMSVLIRYCITTIDWMN